MLMFNATVKIFRDCHRYRRSMQPSLVIMLYYIITFCNIYELLRLWLDRECSTMNVLMTCDLRFITTVYSRSRLNLGY